MAVTRRQFLIGAGLAAAATGGLTACGSDSGSGGEGGGTNMAFAWWGNAVRNENTNKAIAAYTAANPGVTIEGQPGEFASYWDKLATQTAGNTAPDIIQMDMSYLAEYAAEAHCWNWKRTTRTSPSSPKAPSTRPSSMASSSGTTPASTACASWRPPTSSRRRRSRCLTTQPGPGTALKEMAVEDHH